MPLELSDGSRVGALGAMAREPGAFRREHEQLFGMLARVLAYELERETQARDLQRLNDSLRAQARGMAAVAGAARALSEDRDPRGAILAAACDAADAPVAFLLEPSGRELISTAMHGVEMAPVTIQAREDSPRGAARAFSSLESYFVADALDHPALATPLVDGDLGALGAVRARRARRHGVRRDHPDLARADHRAVGVARRRAAAARRAGGGGDRARPPARAHR